MKLHDHDDFQAALVATAAELSLPEQFVEKDYYVTEILRIITETHPGRTIIPTMSASAGGSFRLEQATRRSIRSSSEWNHCEIVFRDFRETRRPALNAHLRPPPLEEQQAPDPRRVVREAIHVR